MSKRFLLFGAITGLFSAAALVASCGARTGLDVPTLHAEGGGGSGGSPERDAGKDAPKDAPPDVHHDAPIAFDCVEAGVTYVYLMTQDNFLLRFYPPTKEVDVINPIQCPTSGGSPFSMAVDRKGIAHVVFDSGELFRVSTKDASCEATPFVPIQHGFKTFGMGFSSDKNDDGETLYVSEITQSNGLGPPPPSKGLASIDLETYELSPIGEFNHGYSSAMELTGTGDAKLYGYMLERSSGGHVLEIDKQNANIIHSTGLGVGSGVDALAFAAWGGAYYIFTSNPNSTDTQVHQFIQGQGDSLYTTIPGHVVVGAGVSTCAPSE